MPSRFFATILITLLAGEALGAGKAEHVVLVVWDGMRPDFVTEQTTPALYKLAQQGVTFARNHAVYPTSTEVNGTALATGVYPGRSGIMANKEYRPALDPVKAIATEDASMIRRGDELSKGRYLAVPTLAETLHRAGRPTAVAGTKPVALLQDRAANRDEEAGKKSMVLFAGKSLLLSALNPFVAQLGAFAVEQDFPDAARNRWTTRALVEQLWKDELPKFSVLWLSEPDFSQHRTGPGSPMALAGLKTSDENLAAVLAALEARGWRESTDVLVVSDHGFSTVARSVDVPALLTAAGFKAFRQFDQPPQRGDIMVVGLGGTVLFYVTGHDEEVTRRLVEFLQQSDFAGVIFSRQKIEGTFTLEQARIATPDAPDVVMAFRWKDDKNSFGTPGTIVGDWQRKPGGGTHATLSPYDVHNTLIAAGPDFKRGWTDQLPSGNVDVAPTILSILGVALEQPMDGRVLSEAFVGADKAVVEPLTHDELATRKFSSGEEWTQHLTLTQFGASIYLDEGNGGMEKNKAHDSR